MSSTQQLEHEIEKLKDRNRKVESDKAWETSLTRKILLMILTYVVITLTLIMIKNANPFQNAIIPTIGFFLSTLTMPVVKNLWLKFFYKK